MKRILIVDDDGDLATLIAFGLRLPGYVVDMAENGSQALRLLQERSFDAVVLDWNMPVMGGEEFLKQYRQCPFSMRAAPVVVITGRPDADQKARELGAVAVVAKPFNLIQLVRVLVPLLGNAE